LQAHETAYHEIDPQHQGAAHEKGDIDGQGHFEAALREDCSGPSEPCEEGVTPRTEKMLMPES
jgi:hypothetical protein